MSKDQRNTEILYYLLVKHKPQADIARADGITRQRVNELKQIHLKRFLKSQNITMSISAPTGEIHTFTKAQIQTYL